MRDTGRMLVHQGAAWPARMAEEPGPYRDWPMPASASETSAKLREVGRMLLRRRRLIIGMVVVLNALAVWAITQVKPRYTAEATLLIGPRQAQVLDLKSVLSGLTGESEVIESEMQLLRARRIARSVVQTLRLDREPEFNPTLKEPGALSRAASAASDALSEGARGARGAWNGLAERFAPPLVLPAREADAAAGAAATERAQDPLALTIDTFLRHLGVAPRGRSRVIAISFDSANPQLAAAAANEVVNTYISDQLRVKQEATAKAHQWLEDRVAEMREQVITADQAVEAYRRRTSITQGRTGTLLSEQISTLGEQQVQARVARANAEARLQAIQGAGAAGRRLDTLPEVQASPTIQSLRAQEGTLLAQAAELSRTYGDQHPRVQAARASAEVIGGRIRAEVGKVAAGLQDEVRAAQAKEAALTAQLAALRKDVNVGTASEVELRALQHEADANRALYDRLLARSRETRVEGGLQQPDAQVISAAEAPDLPSFPKPAIILPIFFLASCIATALLVFALENLDHGFSSLEELEQKLGVAAIGIVPRLRRGLAGPIGEREGAALGEAVRNLYTSLMLSSADKPPKVVLVTSSMPGEGKTSVVLSLARLLASCGKRIAVIDCDLRRPDLPRMCGLEPSPGLVDCLAGRVGVFDALQCDTVSPMFVLASGSKGRTSPDLFASDGMRKLVASLSERFDLVLLDSSPVLAASDTRHLCRLADKTVFLVRWQDTRRFAVTSALRQVVEAGGNLAGVLLSMVDLKQYPRHSESGVYQRRIGLYLAR